MHEKTFFAHLVFAGGHGRTQGEALVGHERQGIEPPDGHDNARQHQQEKAEHHQQPHEKEGEKIGEPFQAAEQIIELAPFPRVQPPDHGQHVAAHERPCQQPQGQGDQQLHQQTAEKQHDKLFLHHVHHIAQVGLKIHGIFLDFFFWTTTGRCPIFKKMLKNYRKARRQDSGAGREKAYHA